MNKVKGNVVFFHREEDDKWLWFIADSYGRAIAKCVNTFNSADEASEHYEANAAEFYGRLNVPNPFKDPFQDFFN